MFNLGLNDISTEITEVEERHKERGIGRSNVVAIVISEVSLIRVFESLFPARLARGLAPIGRLTGRICVVVDQTFPRTPLPRSTDGVPGQKIRNLLLLEEHLPQHLCDLDCAVMVVSSPGQNCPLRYHS